MLATKGIGRAGMRVARWSVQLLCFLYDIEYRPGAQNQAADCLSRLPLPVTTEDIEEPEMVAAVFAGLHSVSMEDFTIASESCPELWLLRTQILKEWPHNKKDVDPALSSFFFIHDELSVQEGLIM